MIRNTPLTLGDIADSVAKALAVQQMSLDYLTKVVLDNRIVLVIFSWTRRCLCCGQHDLLSLDQHFWGSWNWVTWDHEASHLAKKDDSFNKLFIWLVWVLGTMEAISLAPESCCHLAMQETLQDDQIVWEARNQDVRVKPADFLNVGKNWSPNKTLLQAGFSHGFSALPIMVKCINFGITWIRVWTGSVTYYLSVLA